MSKSRQQVEHEKLMKDCRSLCMRVDAIESTLSQKEAFIKKLLGNKTTKKKATKKKATKKK